MRRWVGAILLLAVVACGDDDGGAPSSGPTYDSPEAMAESLGCTDFEVGELDDDLLGPNGREATGTCDLDGEQVELNTYEDQEHLEQYVSVGETTGCAFVKGFGISEINYAIGNLWTATPEDNLDDALVARLADALGGETRKLEC